MLTMATNYTKATSKQRNLG